MRRIRALLKLLLIPCIGMTGCAINPYVVVQRPDLPASAPAGVRVQAAVDYANRVYDGYSKMPSDEFERQRNLSSGLLIAGAAVLGMAAGHAHRDAITGTVLVGGTAYQIGTWNTSTSRQAIYIEGRKALSCGRAAVAPLAMTDAELLVVRKEVRATVDAAIKASRAAGDVSRWLALASSRENAAASPLVTASQAELAAFGERFDAANKVIVHAGGAERLVASAGGLLVAHVDNVRTLVDSSLNDTLASLQALPRAIGDLGKAASIFAPSLDLDSTLKNALAAPKAAGGGNGVTTAEEGCIDAVTGVVVPCQQTTRDPIAQLTEALGRLRSLSGALEVQTNALRSVDPMALEKMQAAIAACNPDIAKAMKPLVAEPAMVEVEAGSPGATVVLISGGTAPYTSSVLSSSMTGISVTIRPDAIAITTGTDTVAGSVYKIRVADGTQASTMVTIKVNPKPAASVRGANKPAVADSGRAGVRSPRPGSTSAPAAAPATAAGVCAPIPPDEVCVSGAKCLFECRQSKPQVANLRERLGLPRTPESFDRELRQKLFDVQRKKGLPATGEYDKETAKAVNQ